MQPTLLILILLGGLGADNPAGESSPPLPEPSASAGQSSATITPPASAPADGPSYAAEPHGDDAMDDGSFRQCFRNTFCSFFLGRDPGVTTAREIEEQFYAGYPVH